MAGVPIPPLTLGAGTEAFEGQCWGEVAAKGEFRPLAPCQGPDCPG